TGVRYRYSPLSRGWYPGHLFPAHEPVRTQEKPLLDVITGFAIILSVIGVGRLLAKAGVISDDKQRLVLNRIAFYSATPALLFSVVADSDPQHLLSPVIVVTFIATLVTAALYCVISAVFFKKELATTAIAAAAASDVDSNTIGRPVSIAVHELIAYVA